MAKAKVAKKVKVKIGVVFGETGRYATTEGWEFGSRPNDKALLREACDLTCAAMPHICIIEVELTPPQGKVLKVKAVKP